MFKKAFITFLFGALLAGCSSSAPLKTSSAVNPEINISDYKTFSWISAQPYIPSGTFLADSTRDRIKTNIYSELINKGYVFVSDPMAADFVVSYTVGSRKEINAKSYPTYYQSGWNLGPAYWGGRRRLCSRNIFFGRKIYRHHYQYPDLHGRHTGD